MVVLEVTSCLLILEVDENAHQHSSYTLACELSRMSDINAFLRINSYHQPIYWLRYSPNGRYFVGGKEKIVSRERRELALKSQILSMMEPGFDPGRDVTIQYLFYSRVSEDGGPIILQSPDYPDILKNVVIWGE